MTPSALTIHEQHMICPTMETALAMRVIEVEAENARLAVALDTAMTTLDQIATTPRNKGARRNAFAAWMFLRTQIEGPNV